MSWNDPSGPHRAHQIREDEYVELSNGHRIACQPAGGRHGGAQALGAMVLSSDPGVEHVAGADVGIAWNDGKNLRAPDLVVGLDLRKPGFATAPPPLAVEYADGGQDEADLRKKIRELLEFGTQLVWVVRLVGPLRVEVHAPGQPVRIARAGDELHAPGILERPVPVRALSDPDAAHETTFHNLLARKSHRARETMRAEGGTEARVESRDEMIIAAREAVSAALAARGWQVPPALQARVAGCTDHATLLRWLVQIAGASAVEPALR